MLYSYVFFYNLDFVVDVVLPPSGRHKKGCSLVKTPRRVVVSATQCVSVLCLLAAGCSRRWVGLFHLRRGPVPPAPRPMCRCGGGRPRVIRVHAGDPTFDARISDFLTPFCVPPRDPHLEREGVGRGLHPTLRPPDHPGAAKEALITRPKFLPIHPGPNSSLPAKEIDQKTYKLPVN